MRLWNRINSPARNRRTRKIEADFRRWSPEQDDFTEKGPATPSTPSDRATAQALMVWSDDGGSTD
jgi:hypothetical protein